jgi:putative membrane-bound dehydrogenase-like protein
VRPAQRILTSEPAATRIVKKERSPINKITSASGWFFCILVLLPSVALAVEDVTRTGQSAAKRFPPLKVPRGFQATLFACDPMMAYPSAIAAGPRDGSIFVAVDYLSGLGPEIVRRDEIRLIEDVDGDGHADKASVYASGFNSIQGLAFLDGTLFVMHAPFLSALRDADGDGTAEVHRDLLAGLGLPPEQNPPRLHCANGVVVGHDGWLYLALGDHGCDVLRPEGDRLVLQGGGILRCRPDGGDLHVFATGLRNIYDIALDEDLDVFVRDNENDGGDYLIRVCHSFFGADHGYPYRYAERPDLALPPLAILGRGSSAGGLCYLEEAFPAEYRGNLFFCEWGRAIVRYRLERLGSSFAPCEQIEFASGADTDPYGFKPTDLIVQRDGSLIVADWADEQQPKRGRGRIYRIAAIRQPQQPGTGTGRANRAIEGELARLDSASYAERVEAQLQIEHRAREAPAVVKQAIRHARLGIRGQLHATWVLAHLGGKSAIDELLNRARSTAQPRVKVQAIRALADCSDPILTQHRLGAGPADAGLADKLAALADGRDPRVTREVLIALARLRWAAAPASVEKVYDPMHRDPAFEHSAIQAMRCSANWPLLFALLDQTRSEPLRSLALRAIADCTDCEVVDGLITRLGSERSPDRRGEYANALARVYKKPGPWVYWGYRPAPRPANTVAWERTDAIGAALDRALADPDHAVRLAVLRRMEREKIATRVPTLEHWLRAKPPADAVAAILESTQHHGPDERRDLVRKIVVDRSHKTVNRLKALALWSDGSEKRALEPEKLLELARGLEDGAVLAQAIRRIAPAIRKVAQHSFPRVESLVLAKLKSPDPDVRTAAIEVAAELGLASAAQPVQELLADHDERVRRAAALAAGALDLKEAALLLIHLARDQQPSVRRASLDSLRRLRERRAVPVAVNLLTDPETRSTALGCIAELGGPVEAAAVADLAKRSPTAEILPLAIRTLTGWSQQTSVRQERFDLDHAVAEVQGATGCLVRWEVTGPALPKETESFIARGGSPGPAFDPPAGYKARWQTLYGTGTDARVRNEGAGDGSKADAVWLAFTDLALPEPAPVEFVASIAGKWRAWANGKRIDQKSGGPPAGPDSNRVEIDLARGLNRLVIELSCLDRPASWQVRVRRISSTVHHEDLIKMALDRAGDPARGRKVFDNVEKSLCLKCHRLGDRGERIGPELTGIGGRFSRVTIIESILEPSRSIAPSYDAITIALKDGRVFSGVRVAESETVVTLADQDAQKHAIPILDIETVRRHPLSLMPDGLEKRLTPEEFVDLVAYLASQK